MEKFLLAATAKATTTNKLLGICVTEAMEMNLGGYFDLKVPL